MVSEVIPVSGHAQIDPEHLRAFVAGFRGAILDRVPAGYDARHVRNGLIDRRPALIARGGDADIAFGRRSAPYLFAAESTWTDRNDPERNITWSRDSLAAMAPFEWWSLPQLPRIRRGRGSDAPLGLRAELRPAGGVEAPV